MFDVDESQKTICELRKSIEAKTLCESLQNRQTRLFGVVMFRGTAV